jgi:hypothetical protein
MRKGKLENNGLSALKTRWHVMVDLVYEGNETDQSENGVQQIRRTLNPLIENGSGIKQVFFMSLPQKD